jgi:adenylate cyclase
VIFAKDAPSPRSERVGQATFLFADLCGFTEYTCRYGDELAADLAVDFHGRVRRLAADEGGSLIKSIGDAVMVHCADASSALTLACRILALRRPDGYPPIRIGIDSGPAVRRGGTGTARPSTPQRAWPMPLGQTSC